MSAKMLIMTVRARWRLFLGIAGGLLAVVLLLSLLWPRTYVAEASVVIDSKSTDPVSGIAASADLLPSLIATQVDVIGSRNVALKVVDKLDLRHVPAFADKFRSATHGVGSIDDWIANLLLKNVNVNPSHDSHVINIDVGWEDPAFAALVANAFASAYMQTSLELRAEPARRQTVWFAEQVKSLRASLEEAQTRLTDAQRVAGVIGTNSQIDIENTRLSELSSQLIAAQAAMYESQNKRTQMASASQLHKLDQMPDLTSNVLLQNLRADVVRAQGQLAETGERFGVHHPQYLSDQAHVNALQRKLALEVQTAAGAITQGADITTRQVAELRSALERQRDRVLQLKRGGDDLDILRRDVETAQHAYDGGLDRASQVHLESQVSQSNAAILNPAVAPSKAAKPNVFLNVMVALVLGCILGLGAVIGVEGADPRVRSGDSLMELTGIVVLADVQPERDALSGWQRIAGPVTRSLTLLRSGVTS